MNNSAKYVIGIDYGTLSGRAVLVDCSNGDTVAQSVFPYPHSVIDRELDGKPLPTDYALQHPQDYLDVLYHTIPDLLRKTGIAPENIVALSTDFTSCSLMPCKRDGTPMCFLDNYKNDTQAYCKMWKHHAAQNKANQLNAIAEARSEEFLSRHGGRISSEWLFPKVWETLCENPVLYAEADRMIEACDWIVWQLTGIEVRSECTCACKAIWHKKNGYPSKDFCKALDPRLENMVEEKLVAPIAPLGQRAGGLTGAMAQRIGLLENTTVAVGNIDAHVSVASAKATRPGQMLGIIGTSTCLMLLSDVDAPVPGVCAVAKDMLLPGLVGYESGQACVGDGFAWFTDNFVPASYFEAAKRAGMSIHTYLQTLGAALKPGESGLLSIDWLNGNRSVLCDVDLSGIILGLTLQTTPEEIYRALMEATAFGARKVIENYRKHGVPVTEFIATGGIAEKSPFLMQMYADVFKMRILMAGSAQGPAHSSAIFGAVAAGVYSDIYEAIEHMGKLKDEQYLPIADNSAIYDRLYAEFDRLHDYLGRGENNVLKNIKNIKLEVKQDA